MALCSRVNSWCSMLRPSHQLSLTPVIGLPLISSVGRLLSALTLRRPSTNERILSLLSLLLPLLLSLLPSLLRPSQAPGHLRSLLFLLS